MTAYAVSHKGSGLQTTRSAITIGHGMEPNLPTIHSSKVTPRGMGVVRCNRRVSGPRHVEGVAAVGLSLRVKASPCDLEPDG